MAEQISKARPDVSYDLLSDDTEAVHASLPAVKYIFRKRGFTSEDAERLTLYGWKRLRIEELDSAAALSPKKLIDYVNGFGMLTINSSPRGASIEIDGKSQSDKTRNTSYPTLGTYRIKLSLDGYEPVEGTCVVTENEPAVFERTLKKIVKNE